MRDRTTIVIAHRPATIALADRVVLLDDGKVAATGTHAELLATSARYREVLAAAEQREAELLAADDAPMSRWSTDATRWPASPRRTSSIATQATPGAPPRRGGSWRPTGGSCDRARVLIVAVHAHDPRRPLPGEGRHRPRHQARTARTRSTSCVRRVPDRRRHRLPRQPVAGRAGRAGRRGLPARPAHPGVRPPAAAVDAVLRPREGGRDRLPHDLRRRLAAGARADGRRSSSCRARAARLPVGDRARRRVVAAAADLPDPGAVRGRGAASSSSATRTAPTSPSATASA